MESGYMYMTDTLKTAGALWDYTCRASAVTHHDKTKKHAFFLCIVFGLHYLCILEINVYNKICH